MSAIVKSKPIKWFYLVPRATIPCYAIPVKPELRFYADPERIKEALDSLCPTGEMHGIEYEHRKLTLIDNPILKNLATGLIKMNQLKVMLGVY